jgi:hypothetical protein
MNYIVEDNFDFYAELKGLKPNIQSDLEVKAEVKPEATSTCMISHEPLTYNSVTLSCNHSFNYLPLYTELCLHNNSPSIHCPYCRMKAERLIPFIPLPGIKKIYGVNYPTKLCMPLPKCSFLLKNAATCGQNGMEYEHGTFCSKHVKHNVDSLWTAEKEQLFKTKSVPQLKQMLREKGLKVGGLKKELINRLLYK